MTTKEISMTINGEELRENVPIRMLLVDFIRDVAGLTGTHVGCTYEGVCGACTVQIDGAAVKSCMLLAVQADGRHVTTIEGLASNGLLHPVQQAFHERHALQCGFCTSGIVMNTVEFLAENPHPSEAEIRQSLIGNICRCTGYSHIVEAVQHAAQAMAKADPR